MCPRLSTRDFVRIYQLDPTGKASAFEEPAYHRVSVIDTRDTDEYPI